MRKLIVTGVLAAAIGAAATIHLTAAASSGHLRLDVAFGADPRVDLGRRGPSVGDLHVIHDRLLREGKDVGDVGGACVLNTQGRPEELCTVTFALPRGTITAEWLNTPPVHKTVAITGGTGRYREARGEAHVTELSATKGVVDFALIGAPASL
jgi:hypothetical protein